MVRLLTLLALIVGLFQAPAQAATITTPSPEIIWPIVRSAIDSGPIDVVVVGGKHLWGVRSVARDTERRVPGLNFHVWRGIRCNDIPRRSLCVKVHKANYGKTGWGGLASTYGSVRYILLNTYYPEYGAKQHISGHELMHTLGMPHHSSWGLCSMPPTWSANYASRGEVLALRRAYP